MPQAYTQSRSSLEQRIYLKAQAVLELADNKFFLVLKPLYGIPERVLH